MENKTRIAVRYRSVDRCNVVRSFATLKRAQDFAARYVGECPEVSEEYQYAVSADGIGRVTCLGCDIKDLFPALNSAPDYKPWSCGSFYTCQKRWDHPDACDFCARNPGCEGSEGFERAHDDTCYYCNGSGESCGEACSRCNGTGKAVAPIPEVTPVSTEDDSIPF